MKILAIESSCDDTSVSVIDENRILSNIISSQYFHTKYGGIVPELASRAHIKIISTIVEEALASASTDFNGIDALAVTTEPGLIGSLIVGSSFAKGLSIKYNIPVIPVNHIEGHIFSGSLQEISLKFPYITLVVSGGHTAIFLVESFNDYKIIGLTRDDAAGEAFDKIAKLLGLGYPGGPLIDKISKDGDPGAYDFPRSMMKSGDYDFSFSGLKTSVRYFLKKQFPEGIPQDKIPDIAASVQAAIVDVLVYKTVTAAKKFNVSGIVVAGGVSANSLLRSQMKESAEKESIKVVTPDIQLCMDNAAMIGYVAVNKLKEAGEGSFSDLKFKANPTALRSKRS